MKNTIYVFLLAVVMAIVLWFTMPLVVQAAGGFLANIFWALINLFIK